MIRAIPGLALGAIIVGAIGSRSRAADPLPFYQSSDKTPEWIGPDDERYPAIHQVADFSLTDQDGVTVTASSLSGKVYVASFFFTECRQLCPKLESNLAKVQQAFRDDAGVEILSHTVTPATDDTAALRRYARANRVISGKWHLLTGPAATIADLARRSYFAALPDTINGAALPLLHSETFVLVDGQRRVRGVYDGSLMYDVERLIADVHTLR